MDKTIQWTEIAFVFAVMDLSKGKMKKLKENSFDRTENTFCISGWIKQYSGVKLRCSLLRLIFQKYKMKNLKRTV